MKFKTIFKCILLISVFNISSCSAPIKKNSNDSDSTKEESSSNHIERKLDSNKILGNWALVGTDNSTFIISKDSIYYPDSFVSFRYSLKADSIIIKYDGYIGSYLIEMKGQDTLVLTGDDVQTFYRFNQ